MKQWVAGGSQAIAVSDVKQSPPGSAYAWLAEWLPGTAAAPEALEALALPAGVRRLEAGGDAETVSPTDGKVSLELRGMPLSAVVP